jgi:cystathionine beta-lyase/cystathionine gamma-synthase
MSSTNKPYKNIDLKNKKNVSWINNLSRVREFGPSLTKSIKSKLGFNTKSVHSGQYNDPISGAVGTPIFQSSTFSLNNETYEAIEEGRGRDSFIYSRYGNPSQWSVQNKISDLENAESSIVFSSGMAAISTSLLAMLDKGSHIISTRDLYGGSYSFLYDDLDKMGMTVSYIDPLDLDGIENAINDETKLIYLETLTNPLLKLIPLKEISAIAKKHNLRFIVDNTFLTPYNIRVLDYGADLVINSATKYLNGHSDLIAGTVSGSRKLMDRVWGQMLKMGGSLDPHCCFMLERSLKTLGIRMEKHNSNALKLAEWLEKESEVNRVIYPGLSSYSQYELSSDLLRNGTSGMISFELKGGDDYSVKFVKRLKIAQEATSLGGIESLISLPFNTSQASLTRSQRVKIGINSGLVRFSCGIEDIEDLKNDFTQAFESLKS